MLVYPPTIKRSAVYCLLAESLAMKWHHTTRTEGVRPVTSLHFTGIQQSHLLVSGEDVQQRGFAGAGRAHDGGQLAGPQSSGHGLQDYLLI